MVEKQLIDDGWMEYRLVVANGEKWETGEWDSNYPAIMGQVRLLDGEEFFVEYRKVSKVKRLPGVGIEPYCNGEDHDDIQDAEEF